MKDSYLNFAISLFGGLKLEIKKLHLRYEDDYFQCNKPFAFGFMLDSIMLDNSDTDWNFEQPMSMNFYREKPM